MKLFYLLTLATLTLSLGWAQQTGKQAEDFKLVSGTGELVSLSDFQGQPLILNTWATWCAPCVEELPFFERIHREVNAEDASALGVLLINNNEAPDKAATFIRDLGVSLPVALDPTPEQLETFRAEGIQLDNTFRVLRNYRVRGMPTTFFIDAEGIIQAVKVGFLLPAEASSLLADIGVSWQP